MANEKTVVGSVRPSQLLWTYGPGALVDLPNLSVITSGTDIWQRSVVRSSPKPACWLRCSSGWGRRSNRYAWHRSAKSETSDRLSAEARVGVPVRPFPRWLRCVKCGLLAPYDNGLFELKENPYRPESTRFVHAGCRGSDGKLPPKDADAVPARMLLACRNGHLDDFPWHWFVHSGPSTCRGTLRFFESGASLQTENLWVRCDKCEAAKSLAQAFGKAGKENLPGCRGRHPHLDRFDHECDEDARAVLLGATNSWFPVSISALAIPRPNASPLQQIIIDHWDDFADVEDVGELKGPSRPSRSAARPPASTLTPRGRLGCDRSSSLRD